MSRFQQKLLRRCKPIPLGLWVYLVIIGSPYAYSSETVDPSNSGSQYAWAENGGWLDAEPLGDGGPGVRILEDRAAGWLWAENLGWISLSCTNTRSCDDRSYGVSVDPSETLSGFAWSENVGWISFSCVNTASCDEVAFGVEVDFGTGELRGFAWSENLGWISFSCLNTNSCATVEYGVQTEVPLPPVEIFEGGFESGDTTGWSSTVP